LPNRKLRTQGIVILSIIQEQWCY